MDDADRADGPIEQARKAAIEQARRAPALLPKGCCHYCEEPVAAGLRFCDVVCRDDFSNEEEALKRAGR
jgi:hypothetical protein